MSNGPNKMDDRQKTRKLVQQKLVFDKEADQKAKLEETVIEEEDDIEEVESTHQVLRGSQVGQHGESRAELNGARSQSEKLPAQVWKHLNIDFFESDSQEGQRGIIDRQSDRTAGQRLRADGVQNGSDLVESHPPRNSGNRWFDDQFYQSVPMVKAIEFLVNERYLPSKNYQNYSGTSQKKLHHFFLRYEFDGKGKLGEFENSYNDAQRSQTSNPQLPISCQAYLKAGTLRKFNVTKMEHQGYLQLAFFNPQWVPDSKEKSEPKYIYIRYYLAQGKLWQANQLAGSQSNINYAINHQCFLIALLRKSSQINAYYEEFLQGMPDLRTKQYYNNSSGFIKALQIQLISGFISNNVRFSLDL